MPDDTSGPPNPLADLLTRSGIKPERARSLAAQAIDDFRTAAPKITYIGLNPEQLTDVWSKANSAGYMSLTIEITDISAQGGQPGHINVQVKTRDARQIPSDPEPFSVPASWDASVEEMRREGARTVEEWEADVSQLSRNLN